MPPIGAQGLNLGLRDAATIAELVVAALKLRVADPIALLAGSSVLLPALLRESVRCAGEPSRKEA